MTTLVQRSDLMMVITTIMIKYDVHNNDDENKNIMIYNAFHNQTTTDLQMPTCKTPFYAAVNQQSVGTFHILIDGS